MVEDSSFNINSFNGKDNILTSDSSLTQTSNLTKSVVPSSPITTTQTINLPAMSTINISNSFINLENIIITKTDNVRRVDTASNLSKELSNGAEIALNVSASKDIDHDVGMLVHLIQQDNQNNSKQIKNRERSLSPNNSNKRQHLGKQELNGFHESTTRKKRDRSLSNNSKKRKCLKDDQTISQDFNGNNSNINIENNYNNNEELQMVNQF